MFYYFSVYLYDYNLFQVLLHGVMQRLRLVSFHIYIYIYPVQCNTFNLLITLVSLLKIKQLHI